MSDFSRYTQQLLLPEIGLAGQQKLQAAKVLIVGAGGLGTPLAASLAAMGVGTLGIIDGDTVETTNLHRQFLYAPGDVGHNKATVLQHKLSQQNPEITITAYPYNLTPENATATVSQYNIVCDCTDNTGTRLLISDTCLSAGKPLVYAAVSGWEGYVTVLHHHKKVTLDTVFAQNLTSAQLDCAANGITPPVCGIAANLQAAEVLKIILGLNDVLDGQLLCFNSLVNVYRVFKLFK